ncbi:MAG TPA: argininosuccinate synthase [Candidatus Omnitrophota bacterium]|nr:argininosuccinate synthase [Candidatus Omnitrophota bacterium]HPB68023.1 argininosuccinate synthase [Candidatus Omnitrophota bacterium]HQO59219.1 argininosuccinate synthase [Candidatus Omnitrophota bacterium]HQP12708.1 argininosuccinate synthase [Candidatus Omnitrophota bacterium]
MKKVVLAYSGGLDTSCAIKWLTDRDYQVIAFIADVGQNENFKAIRQRAMKTGAAKVYVLNLQKEFVLDYVFPALKAGAIYENKYLLATALSRPLIARHLVEIAKKEDAAAVAHGCTGKGNDQVRFETTVSILNPKLEQIAPVRIWEFKTREEEIEYARQHRIPVDVTKKSPYSIDKNLYGRSIECGVLEDPWTEPPEEIYQMTQNPQTAPQKPENIEISFTQGIPAKLNGKSLNPVSMIQTLNDIGGRHGVGRVDAVENRLVGIKSREIYENPAGTILHLAHQELEYLVLDRETVHFKHVLAYKYAEMVYYGLWETPMKKQLDALIAQTQEELTGTVRLKLYKGSCTVTGRKSPFSRYKLELATYGDKDVFNQKLAEGFNRLWSLPYQRL